MCNTYSIEIVSVNCSWTLKRIWCAELVADDPPTHLIILFTTSSVVEPLTATRSSRSSPTHPVWGGDLFPRRGTLLGRVGHIEVGYTFPTSCSTTEVVLQERYY